MPDDHGEMTYTEAVAAGLYPTYGPECGSADLGMTTYGIEGTLVPPKFGHTEETAVIVIPAQRR